MEVFNLGIIADDLTGAMDTSCVFMSRGVRAIVAMMPGARPELVENGVLCFNTQSRFANSTDAAKLVTEAAKSLVDYGCASLYKKIDSTLRGHVGVEIAATLQASQSNTAFVCPAFPAMGRTVENGIAYVNGNLLSETQEGREVFDRTKAASVTELLAEQSGLKIGLIDASAYTSPSSVENRIASLIMDGCQIIVFDAFLDEHLALILESTRRWSHESILVGSAGLASAIAGSLDESTSDSRPQMSSISTHPVVLISGSLNDVTQRQLEALGQLTGMERIPLDATRILNTEAESNAETHRVVVRLRTALERNLDAALFWSDADTIESTIQNSQDSSWIIERLGGAINSITTSGLDRKNFCGLVIVGGETAYAVLRSLKANAIDLRGQVLEGVPYGKIIGGTADGKMVITKAGGFGNEAALVSTVSYARQLRGK